MFFLLGILMVFALPARAELRAGTESWRDLSAYAGRYRFGLEIEAGGPVMGNVVQHYNFDELVKQLPPDFFDKPPAQMTRTELLRYVGTLSAALAPKPGAPAILKKLMVEPDNAGGSLSVSEFQHRPEDAITDPVRYLNELGTLARLLKIEQGLDHPGSRKGYSYHVHISRAGKPIPDSTLQLLNFRLMLKLAGKSVGAAFHPNSTVAYREDLAKKGLVRRIAPDRFELRFHFQDPVTELRDVLEILDAGPAGERRLLKEIQDALREHPHRGDARIVAAYRRQIVPCARTLRGL